MPHTSFIEKSRKHNFHFERNPQKILQLRKLIMALRHLIKAAKVTKRKLIWWRWKAFVFKYVSLQTTNIQQGFKDTELCKYDVFDIHTHNDSLKVSFNRIIKRILLAMYEIITLFHILLQFQRIKKHKKTFFYRHYAVRSVKENLLYLRDEIRGTNYLRITSYFGIVVLRNKSLRYLIEMVWSYNPLATVYIISA